MKLLAQLTVFCLLIIDVLAQDPYHTALQNDLQNNYGLPAGAWLLNDTESANLNSDYHYGNLTVTDLQANNQLFSNKVHIQVHAPGANQWDAGYGIRNINQMDQGDVALLVIWLRAEAGGDGQVSVFVENSSTFEKEVYLTFNPPAQWTQYFIPFDANTNYAANGLSIGTHLAWQTQTIEVGGLAVLNYGNNISIDDLPSKTHNEQYGGWEPDAPWRTEAADRIEQIRKADLTIRVEDTEGNPIPDVNVEVSMIQHEFAFGSAVVSSRFAGNPNHNQTYESKILDLDGKGHGFNWVVFENALKWPGWENNWITTPPQTAHAAQWLRDHDIKIRGHCLVWPGWSNLPNDLEPKANDLTYLKNRIFNHIEDINTYPGIEGNIAEWDVLNEITTNRSLEMALSGTSGYPTGREIYVEIFNKLEEVIPGMTTYLNDYVTISQANTGGGNYDLKKQFAQELIDSGVKLDGIGFQGHIGAFPTSIYDVQTILDDFYDSFGKSAKITEYDTNEGMGDSLAATYLRDFLTMVFSHPSMNGFMTWGFWDGAHWHGNAPFFYEDWTPKPAGEAFIDLVFNEWWTEETGQTNNSGAYSIRGYKGSYQVKIDHGNGNVFLDTFSLSEDMTILQKGGQIISNIDQVSISNVKLYPNPAKDFIRIETGGFLFSDVRIINSLGQIVFKGKMEGPSLEISLPPTVGLYQVVLESDHQFISKTFIKQ